MKKQIIKIGAAVFSFAVCSAFAAEVPLVYSVENTGAEFPDPTMPSG
ncbi:MAG: hypothetical protein HUK20_05955, partial [Fibrobacter sp.]|nr:hypothetical protein [Fibrobacter sp.]